MTVTESELKKAEAITGKIFKHRTCGFCSEIMYTTSTSTLCSNKCRQGAFRAKLIQAQTPSKASVAGVLNTALPDEKKIKKEISESDKKELNKIKEELTPAQKKQAEKFEKQIEEANKQLKKK